MNSHAMLNLVGLRDGSPSPSMEDQAKHDTLVAMQVEALTTARREHLSTADFKENKLSYVPTVHLESHRLVNKSSIGEGVKSKLEGWNNAWTSLQYDGTDAQNLKAVNEGLGQTHRARLMNDDSVRDYTGDENFRGSIRRGKGGRAEHGSRGGGNAGRPTVQGGAGKTKVERRVKFHHEDLVQPITRVRIPKSHLTAQIDVAGRQPVPILKKVLTVKPAKGNVAVPSTAATSFSRPASRCKVVLAAPSAFMASIGTRKEQARHELSIKVVPPATNTLKLEATGQSIDASITKTRKTSNETAMAHKSKTPVIAIPSDKTTRVPDKPTASSNSRPKADLIDLDTGQETTHPVLQFTASSTKEQIFHHTGEASSTFDQHIDALEKSGALSAAQLNSLKVIQAQVHARENAIAPLKESPRRGGYTKAELVSLRPTPADPKIKTNIAKKFAEEQSAFLIIGEHVYKTRYHTAASLTEDFQKLSISDKQSVKLTATNPPTTRKSTIFPFDPPPIEAEAPSLPARLLTQTTTADHGAAARVQHSGRDNGSALISYRQSLRDLTATPGLNRRNMINQTGFIALAEKRVNPVAAGEKEEEDPLRVAHKRSL